MSDHMCNYISSSTVFPGIKSDYNIIYLNLTINDNKKGEFKNKFNSQFLHDTGYVEKSKSLINKLNTKLSNIEDKG